MSLLDDYAKIPAITRKTWIEKPDLPDDMFYYDPTYSMDGEHLLYNYEESDKSLRERLNKTLNDK